MVVGRASLGLLSVATPQGVDWRGQLGSLARYVEVSRAPERSARVVARPSPPLRRA
jgi:hypothetical protein